MTSPVTTVPTSTGGQRASMAAAFRNGFSALGRTWPSVYGLMTLLAIGPYLALNLTYRLLPAARLRDPRFGLAIAAVMMLCGALANQAITRRLLDTLAGAPGSFFQALLAGARSLPVLLPLFIVESWSHFLLPFVPIAQARTFQSLIEFAAFLTNVALVASIAVTDVIALEERGSLLSAMRRAYRMIRDHRWILVLVYVAMRVIETVPYSLVPFVMTLFGPGAMAITWYLVMPAIAIFRMLLAPPFRAFVVDYYRQLCRLRDGVAPGEAAVVFD